jgi:hypothetical protein
MVTTFSTWSEFIDQFNTEINLTSDEIASIKFLENLDASRSDLDAKLDNILSDSDLFIFDAGLLTPKVNFAESIRAHEEFWTTYRHTLNGAAAGQKISEFVSEKQSSFPLFDVSNEDRETYSELVDIYTGPGYKLGWSSALKAFGASTLDGLVLVENAVPNGVQFARATFLKLADEAVDQLEGLAGLEQIQNLNNADKAVRLFNVTVDLLSGVIGITSTAFNDIKEGSLKDFPDELRKAGSELLNFFIGSDAVKEIKTFNSLNLAGDAIASLAKLQESLDNQIKIEQVSTQLESPFSLSHTRFIADEALAGVIQSSIDLFQTVSKLVKVDKIPLVGSAIEIMDVLINIILDSGEAIYSKSGISERRAEQALNLLDELVDSVSLLTASQLTRINVYSDKLDTFGLKIVPSAPDATVAVELKDSNGDNLGQLTIEAPTQDQGSEIEFSLNISTSGVGTQYRVALIIDVSGSMGGTRIVEAKAAYIDLINYLKDQGIADVTEFAVVPFQSSATLYEGLSADEAIARINTLNAGGGTEFGPAISRGLEFFDGARAGLTQIAYFLSDGQGSGASTALQAVAEVRAFGISSGASISSLNTIDSNNAVILNSASDLAASFTESEIKTADVDKIEVYLNGTLAQTITGDQLTDNGATGLTFAGTINGLDTSNKDILEAKVFFQDISIPAQSVTFEIGDGVTEAAGTDGDDNIAFSLSQKVVDAGGGTDTVLANNLNNTVIKTSGGGVIKLYGGNDGAILSGAGSTLPLPVPFKLANSSQNEPIIAYALSEAITNEEGIVLDGGAGIDTVTYSGDFAAHSVQRAGGLIQVSWGTSVTDSLSNVEFLQFDDVKVRISDLSVVQTLSGITVEVTETDSGTQIAFTVNLDAASGTDVTFDYATANGTAEAGRDFTAANGSITLLSGETKKTITIDVTGDTEFEGDEAFELQLTNANGAVFDGGGNTYSITGMIKNDDDANQFETGSVGDDIINTGKGNDQINSGAGSDIVNANLGNDLVIDGLGNNNLNGEGGADAIIALSGLNTLTGGDGSDYLAGGFQADNLNGGAGNDVLRGDAGGFLGGSDILVGGADDDFLMGGRGADTFVFNTNDGSDVIAAFDVADIGFGPLSGYTATATGADFQSGVDHIQLAGFSTVDVSNVMSWVTDGADGAVFSAEGTSITFYDVAANQLTTDDFIIV